MWRLLVLIVTIGLSLVPGMAQAQATPTLSSLDISLWSEYDRPDMLVIYRGLLTADTPLPAAVEFRIPASAGQPTAVAYLGDAGQQLNQQYTTRLDGEWLVVSFELSARGFQLEYYVALEVDSAGQREFSYTYAADYPTGALSLDVQVPLGAQKFALEPAADTVVQEADGLTYHLIQAGALTQGESKSWTITYRKADSTLTAASLALIDTPAATPPPAESADNSSIATFVIAFVALLAVGGGAFWLGRHTQPSDEPVPLPPRSRKRRGDSPSRTANAETLRVETEFCHQCGVRLRHDAEFCHKCGTAVRKW